MSENFQSKEFDRLTALEILKELSKNMRPTNDIFGNKTLVIDRRDFEAVRAKYLNGRKEE